MTWLKVDCDWGLPVINLAIARAFLVQARPALSAHGILAFLEECNGVQPSPRLEAWIGDLFRETYPGAQLVGSQYDLTEDVLLLMVMHPRFPRTKAYARVPRWQVTFHNEPNAEPWFSIEELGACVNR